MINGLEGIPGSGKSYEAVAFHVLEALKSGRKVVTNLPLNVEAFASIDPVYRSLIEIRHQPANIRGVWDAADIAKKDAFQLFDDGHVEVPAVSAVTFGGVWDYYSTWRDDEGRGVLFVIDECHVALPKVGTPDSVVQWFKLQRHFNVDVLLITQSFRDINQPIAQLLATVIKCRKADVLGKADYYIRKVHAGYRGALIQTDQRPYKPQYFSLYRSHTQGTAASESAAQDMSPMIVKFNRVKWVVLAVGVVAMAWAFWPKPHTNVWGVKRAKASEDHAQAPAVQASASAAHASSAPASAAVPAVPPASAASDPAPQPEKRDPMGDKGLHVVGDVVSAGRRVVAFAVSTGQQQQFVVTSDELQAMGYRVTYLSYCGVWLEFDGQRRFATCDAPQSTMGRADRPIVIQNGSRSDQPLRGAGGRRPV